ncbi:unnamed protein product, partial [Staurois parvus]
MRCPWYLFHRLFLVRARTQGPHDPLLPGDPMSCHDACQCPSVPHTSAHQCPSVPPISVHQCSLLVP